MSADPILLLAGKWLGIAAALLLLLTVAAFIARWGVRFRLVGVTSFTALLAISCAAFALSYSPRVSVAGAVRVPIVYDNGEGLVVAAAPADLAAEAILPTLEQVARNLRGGGRQGDGGAVTVRLRQLQTGAKGTARPQVLAEATLNLRTRELQFRS